MQKMSQFSRLIGMPQANVLKSIGCMDKVLFLTIGNPDIYQHKSFGKMATVFIRVTKNYRNWLSTYLIFSAIDIWLTNIQRLYIYRITNSWEEYCIHISYRFQMHLQAAFLFAQEIGKFFCINRIGSFKLNNSMTTQNKNFKNISSGSRNDALPMYNRYKIPKSRETVSLSPVWKVNIFYWL